MRSRNPGEGLGEEKGEGTRGGRRKRGREEGGEEGGEEGERREGRRKRGREEEVHKEIGREKGRHMGRGRGSREGKVRLIMNAIPSLLLQQQDNRFQGGGVQVVSPQREEEVVQLFGGLLTVHDDCSHLPLVGHAPLPGITATTIRL